MAFDVIVTSQQREDTEYISNSGSQWLMVAADGPYAGNVLLNIGQNTFINLSNPSRGRKYVYDFSFKVRPLAFSEAVTLVVSQR